VGLSNIRETGGSTFEVCAGIRSPHLAMQQARDGGCSRSRGASVILWIPTFPSSPDGRRSLDFAAAVLPFAVTGGSSTVSIRSGRLPTLSGRPTASSPLPHALCPDRAEATSRTPLLSYTSECAPPPTSPRPSADPGPSLDPSEPRLPASARVPPSWFPTTSTVSSGARFPACCSRYRTWGSSGFTGVDRHQPRLGRIASRIPSDAHTLRRFSPRR
jgi:hypothetical protein